MASRTNPPLLGIYSGLDQYTEMRNNSNWLPDSMKVEFVRPEGKRRQMAVGLSVIGGLLLVGFAISRLKTRREARKDVLKLF
jgi:hypothetical protein